MGKEWLIKGSFYIPLLLQLFLLLPKLPPWITYSSLSMWPLCCAMICTHLSLALHANRMRYCMICSDMILTFLLSLNKQKCFSASLHLSHFFVQNIISGTKSITSAPFIFYIFYCYLILMFTYA